MISTLVNLRYLDVLYDVHACDLVGLTNLTELECREISPMDITHLKKLQILNIEDSDIEEILSVARELPNLRQLDVIIIDQNDYSFRLKKEEELRSQLNFLPNLRVNVYCNS